MLAALGLGALFAKRGKDKLDRREEERLRDEEDRRREEEDNRRAGRRTSRYTGDGYPSPGRRDSRRQSHRPPPSGITMTNTSMMSEDSSIEPRGSTPYEPAPPGMRPPPPAPIPVPGGYPPAATPGAPPVPIPVPVPMPYAGTASGPHSRYDVTQPASMPPMPADPRGIFHHPDSGSEAYDSPSGHRRRRETDPAAAAAAAAASASVLAAQEDDDRHRRGDRGRDQTTSPQSQDAPPVSVRVRVNNERDNITLRRLTEEEARREQNRRRRGDSVSSVSGGDTTPTASRRYRRDSSSQHRAETAAEKRVEAEESDPLAPLPPPNPSFAAGARRAQQGNKDSAYYSGQPGPSGGVPAAGATVSSLGSRGGFASPGESHATFTSGPMTDTAADRRRRRRLERRDGSKQPTRTDFS